MTLEGSYQSRSYDKITLGCPILDEKFCGGIPCRMITEFVDESGVGKTQFCLQLALNVQLPVAIGGLQSSCIYFYNDKPFPFKRLDSMSEAFHCKYHTQIQHNTVDNIYIEKIDSIYDFIEQFPRIQSFITTQSIEAMPIRLLVIDNVTSLFRTYFENSARDMRRCAELIN